MRTTIHGSLVAGSNSAVSHCDLRSGRIAQTKFGGERNLDLNQEFPRTRCGYERARVNVRFGSKADMGVCLRNVRFISESGH